MMSDSVEFSDQKPQDEAKREIIELQVGDHLFRVDKRILLSKEDTFFNKLLSDRWRKGDGPLKIGRSADYFDVILRHLNGESGLTWWGWYGHEMEKLSDELDFYGLTELHEEIVNLMGDLSLTSKLGMHKGVYEIHAADDIPIERRIKASKERALVFNIKNDYFIELVKYLEKFRSSSGFSNKFWEYGLFVKIVAGAEKNYVNIIDPWMGPYYKQGICISDTDDDVLIQRTLLWAMVDYETSAAKCRPIIPEHGFIYEYTGPEVESDKEPDARSVDESIYTHQRQSNSKLMPEEDYRAAMRRPYQSHW